MSNVLLYNEERPVTFGGVVGNGHITDLLRLLVARGGCRNAHFILSGLPGTGKTTIGRILARAINCLGLVGGEPCNVCESCVANLGGSYGDYIEVDATCYSKVEDARRLVELAGSYPISVGGQRVILLDEAHVLSNASFDKFLNLLESGDVRTTFIFCTTDLHLFRPAIVSRCFLFEVRPLVAGEIAGELLRICRVRGIEYDLVAIRRLSHHYAGRPRDAVKVLDLHVKARGCFVEYVDRTDESILLECFRLAYFGKVDEYLVLLGGLGGDLYVSVCRMLNEVYFYPTVEPVLLCVSEVEVFRNLVDAGSLRLILRDVMQFKPSCVYTMGLLLSLVSELGVKLVVREGSRRARVGRRFRGDVVESIDLEDSVDDLKVVDLEGFGFREGGV